MTHVSDDYKKAYAEIFKPRTPVFTVQTPYPALPHVTLLENTWIDHIVSGHPEMFGLEHQVFATLASPVLVCTASNINYVSFVSGLHYDAKGHPLLVVVSPVDTSGSPVVTTAFYSKKHVSPLPQMVIWKP